VKDMQPQPPRAKFVFAADGTVSETTGCVQFLNDGSCHFVAPSESSAAPCAGAAPSPAKHSGKRKQPPSSYEAALDSQQ
jgi:hypothetical protein